MTVLHSEDARFNPQAPRYWQVRITDNDGEEQEYLFEALHAWDVIVHIGQVMARDGDFYGHKTRDTMNLGIVELCDEPDTYFTISKGNTFYTSKIA
jgi:hypothetical protein